MTSSNIFQETISDDVAGEDFILQNISDDVAGEVYNLHLRDQPPVLVFLTAYGWVNISVL